MLPTHTRTARRLFGAAMIPSRIQATPATGANAQAAMPAPSPPSSSSSTSRTATPPPVTPRDKGKQRADPAPGRLPSPLSGPTANATLVSMLDDALSTSLDLPDSPQRPAPRASTSFSHARSASFDAAHQAAMAHPHIAHPHLERPAPAHHSPGPLHPTLRPRLVSQLTRATLPTSSLSYAQAEDKRGSWASPRQRYVSSPVDESVSPWGEGLNGGFPDLDPATGLPLSRRRTPDIADSPSEPRYPVQRTISELLRGKDEAEQQSGFFGLPQLPSLPPLLGGSQRPSPDRPGRMSSEQRRLFNSSTASLSDWGPGWFGIGKNKVDTMLSEEDQAATVAEEQAKIQVKYDTPQYPMVFCHGLLGFDYLGPSSLPPLQISHWRGIREVLEANGVDVLIARVPATSSIKERAQTLHDVIAEKYPGQTVNLVAHSMGGLDCRYLISQLQPEKFKVASLTTISTPHRGSPFADYVIDNVIGRDRLPQLLSIMESMNLPNSGDGAAFQALGTRAMKVFNTEVVDDPDVKYYSWGASFHPGLLDTFRWPHSVILAKEGPNDGLVSVHSARWGEYRGTLLGVNHLDLVGWVNTVKNIWSGWTGSPITFKPATFYLEISDYLAKQKF